MSRYTTPFTDPASKSMDDLVALCKRRGFVYPASEIYGGIRGFWDYGPLGTALKNNIRDHWWRCMVDCPPIGPDGDPVTIVGLDSAIIQHPRAWEASGHVGGFNDPMVDDTETKQRFRSDHLVGVFVENFENDQHTIATTKHQFGLAGTIVASAVGDALATLTNSPKQVHAVDPVGAIKSVEVLPESDWAYDGWVTLELTLKNRTTRLAVVKEEDLFAKGPGLVPSPFTGKQGTLTEPRQFNLMLATEVGAVDPLKAYLRPETAQGIFLNFKNVVDTMRVKVPFGIAQIGKSFRNEVTPRNYIFRSREFEQMEMEFFCPPDESQQWYEFWRNERYNWWLSLGVDEQNLILRDHDEDELSHYSNATVDVEYRYPFTAPGHGELEGVAHRGNFDLTQHTQHSGKDLSYFDQALQLKLQAEGVDKAEIKERSRYLPHVIEPASGLTRAVLVLLCEAFTPTPDRKGSDYMMAFKPKFAPVKAGVYPLVNKDGMPETARKLYDQLRTKHTVEYDAKQSIGKRYARMDEIGTPFCFTVDGDTATDQAVTVRHRDTQAQERVALDKVDQFLTDHLAD